MKSVINVLRFTILQNIKKKSYIISTVIELLIISALLLVPSIISRVSKGPGENIPGGDPGGSVANKGIIYIIDNPNIFNNDTNSFKNAFPEYEVAYENAQNLDNLKTEITESEESESYLIIINEENEMLTAEYFFKEYGKGPSPDRLNSVIKDTYDMNLMEEAAIPADIISKLMSPLVLKHTELGTGYVQNQIIGAIIIMLLFFAIYYYGYWVATSVASEKTSRVIEVLVTSTKPKHIIIGKTIAMGALGLFQLLLIILTAITVYKLTYPDNFTLFGMSIDFSSFTPLTFIIMLIYFLLGFGLYATLNAVAGASVSKSEDVNSAIMPISMISLVAFYISYFPSMIPGSSKLVRVASLIPFSSPFSMPNRIIKQDVPTSDIIISLALLVITTIIFSWISVKIYSAAVLHFGKRLKFKEMFRLAKEK